MFLGHYGLALAAKRAAPRTSLGTLTFAAQFADELWPILLPMGLEQVRIVPVGRPPSRTQLRARGSLSRLRDGWRHAPELAIRSIRSRMTCRDTNHVTSRETNHEYRNDYQ